MYSASTKLYYPRLDFLKFLCCVGVVAIHTKPFFFCNPNMVISETMQFLFGMSVPLFFMVSAYLFWGKVSFGIKEDFDVLKHFVFRLFVLYTAWSILILPSWFIGFYHRYPGEWLYLLPLKFFITGAPHGSWFIMSLIQGTLLCYVLNKYLGKIIATILCLAITFYVNCVFHGMPDYLNVYYQYKEFDIWFSPFNAVLYIQLGYLVRYLSRQMVYNNAVRGGGGLGLSILIMVLLFVLRDARSVCFFIEVLLYSIILFFCAIPAKKKIHDFSMLRKMSIIIYFTHFVLVIICRTLVEKGFMSYEFGFREFFAILLCTSGMSYIIVKLSEKFRFLKYLY